MSRNIEFQLRGLCDRSQLDTEYMVTNHEETGLITYVGKKNTMIQYDQRLYQWNISVANNPVLQAVSYSGIASLVIGKHLWHIFGDYACSTQEQSLELALSSCSKSQFTCSDGFCIDILARCDNVNDCRDKSDEANCERVRIEQTYQKFIVPPPKQQLDNTEVIIGVTLETLMDINEVDGVFKAQFYLTMIWFESRAQFKNLKVDMNLNNFLPSENSQIWVPELTFENTEEKPATVVNDKTEIKVERRGHFKLSEKSENENVQYFDGSENPLHMTHFYNQKFLCNYQMAWYPFDIQICKIILIMKPAFAPFTKLKVGEVLYTGQTFLTNYEVKSVTMNIVTVEGNEAVSVEILLSRQLLSVVMNVFVPTTVLNLISYSTNFYKDCYFEAVITINLTSMLVLVALFVSVSLSKQFCTY